MAIQDDIDALQGQVDAMKGDVSGVPPATCSLTGLKSTITDLEAQIRVLRTNLVAEDNPFSGTTMTLRLDTKNVPTLAGLNPAAVALINDIGVKPAAIRMGDVTVSVSSNSIVLSVAGEPDVLVIAEKLAAFAAEKNITVDVSQVQALKDSNVEKAEQFLALVQLQENIITTVLEGEVITSPLPPDICIPDIVMDDKEVVFDVTITGTDPITVNINWGDGIIDTNASFPATHTYDEYGEYTVTVTATNEAGSDEKTMPVVVTA